MPIFRLDRSLLERFRRGAPEALTTVYWEYLAKVEHLLRTGFDMRSRRLHVAGALGRPNELADLVQEVFLRAFSTKGRLAFDGRRDYGPYILAIARNILVDWARVKGREIPLSPAEIEAASEEISIPEESPPWADPETVRIVEDYLSSLPLELREVHRLRYEEALSQTQAAERLGVGRQTLRTLESRLRSGLSAALDAAGLGDMPNSDRIGERGWAR